MTYYPPTTAFSPESISLITDNVVHAILTANVSMLYSLLSSPQSFEPSPLENSPVVVNVPDVKGWSAIHYCVSEPNPSVEMLDLLYHTGADVSLALFPYRVTMLDFECTWLACAIVTPVISNGIATISATSSRNPPDLKPKTDTLNLRTSFNSGSSSWVVSRTKHVWYSEHGTYY